MDSKPLVPRLRFPEFRDAPWDVLNGNFLFDTVDRRPAPLGLPVLAITQEQGAISRDDIDYHVSVTAASIASYKEVRPADFIISLRSFQGGIEYSQVHGICSPAYIILKRKGDGSDDFYRQLFKSPRFIQQITRNIEGLRDGKMISYKQFSEQLLPAPSPPEQQKIAECLTSLDELIAAEGRKLEALRTYKKGLMQNLFPREGETTPRLRFPEFRDAPGWEQRPLGLEALFFKGRGISKADVDPNGSYPCIRYGELYTRYGEVIDTVYSRTSAPKAELFLSSKNDIIIPASGETKEDIATASCVMLDGVALGGDINVLRTNHNGVFLSYLINAVHRRAIAKVAQGHTVVHLYPSQLAQVPVVLPKAPEQEKIAECLTALDALITAQAKKLDPLKLHKQGLMQSLFPSLDEVVA